jgi:ATP-dependent helicase HrpB
MELPVDAVLGDLRAALGTAGRAVLQAPPGAGKTTRVPLDLLAHGLSGRLLLLEPRRVAARAAATRLAAQLAEPLGERVGLTTRDERRVSAATRIEVVTEGVLLRRLQADPQLSGVGLVFFDEFHERSLEADLGLALVEEVRAALREDLRVLVASATLDAGRVARLLGGAPVVTAEGRQHPVEIEHRPRPTPGQLAPAVADAVREVAGTGADAGDVLVFLPGAAEIRRVAAELDAHPPSDEVLVLPLHGSLPPAEQDRALQPAPNGQRKVVLATDLAETSLTIEGVRTVVDAGLAREPRFDAARGMSGLVTVAASRASAEQRAGRAGRTAPGRCVRLWPASEHPTRDASARPAILTDDLAPAALELAAWGARLEELALLDRPPVDAWRGAHETLSALGALDDRGRITEHGRRLAALPLHPRLGHLLLEGAAAGHGRLAAEVAALLADRDVLTTGPGAACADMTVRVACLRGLPAPSGTSVRSGPMRRARREARRLARHLDRSTADATTAGRDPDTADLEEVGWLLAVGWPERVAARRPGQRGAFLLAGGRGASLPDDDLLADEAWLAVAALDRGRSEARIHLAAPVTPDQLRSAAGARIELVEEVAWRDGDVSARQEERLGALVLDARPLQDVDPQALLDALLDGVSRDGLDLLSWRHEDRQLQARIQLLHDHLGSDYWPDVSDEALQRDAEEILGPFLLGARRRADLAALDVGAVLRSRLAPGAERELERLAPTHLEVPSGSRIRLDYTEGEVPVLAVRIQEVLGAATHPTVLDGRLRLLVHLLSPARRPVQVTDDLPGFWDRAYPQVRAELRGRYPKHDWPEDPWAATPTRGVRRRRRS